MGSGRYAFLSDWVRSRIFTLLEEIPPTVTEAIDALDRSEPCDVLLGIAADLRRQVQQVEDALLDYQLQTCLLPEMQGLAEIGHAVFRLAGRRTGALIAIERRDPIGDVVRLGVSLDARVSAPLLESIFYSGNPLHDGGVIIRDQRVVSAACVFPLAAHLADTYRKFGTRHRAAVGLSQATDALVLVVSEETGHASISLAGRLYTVPDPKRLLDQIVALSGKS
jgi:diadenylate cyclase